MVSRMITSLQRIVLLRSSTSGSPGRKHVLEQHVYADGVNVFLVLAQILVVGSDVLVESGLFQARVTFDECKAHERH